MTPHASRALSIGAYVRPARTHTTPLPKAAPVQPANDPLAPERAASARAEANRRTQRRISRVAAAWLAGCALFIVAAMACVVAFACVVALGPIAGLGWPGVFFFFAVAACGCWEGYLGTVGKTAMRGVL